ncbi:MAG: hypothetical protein NTW25_03825 [Candidatus Kapabacteria bacterium]|nr:hypothetical protein [Candidatus Kapabacteria bacterium]
MEEFWKSFAEELYIGINQSIKDTNSNWETIYDSYPNSAFTYPQFTQMIENVLHRVGNHLGFVDDNINYASHNGEFHFVTDNGRRNRIDFTFGQGSKINKNFKLEYALEHEMSYKTWTHELKQLNEFKKSSDCILFT